MRLILICFLILRICSFTYAKGSFYPLAEISEGILESANSVVRHREVLLTITSSEKIKYEVSEVITVLNSKGQKNGVLYLPYNEGIKPDIIEANFYNSDGKLLDKVKNSEIYDQAYFDGFSLFSEARFKQITPHINVYPYTVEYVYVLDFEGVIDYPDWTPINTYNESVQFSSYKIEIEDNTELRVWEDRIERQNDDYFWKIENRKALKPEPHSVGLYAMVPSVEISPNEFVYYGVAGNMKTWDGFSTWVGGLLKGRDVLPEKTVTEIKELTADLTSEHEKIGMVYKYMQNKTRYVSVQLGIGGFQPFSAQTVDEVGYGDCKALSNYMKALLACVGIESYYTLINAGTDNVEIKSTFPSQDFNHVILTVPVGKDTLFLECTDQFAACGYLGDFTSDRYALMISENGGQLIRTKRYDETQNTWELSASICLTPDGSAQVSDTTIYSGLQSDFVKKELRKTKEKQIEQAFKTNQIAGANFLDISYAGVDSIIPKVGRTRDFEVSGFAVTAGSRMFLPMNVLNKRTRVPRKIKNRQSDFELKMAYSDKDKIIFTIPEGYELEYLPKTKQIKSDFGQFEFQLHLHANKLIYKRNEVRFSGIFPAEKYLDYVNFCKEIVDSDGQKIILKKL